MKEIDNILTSLIERRGSDLHVIAGDPLRARIYGELTVIDDTPLSNDKVTEFLNEIIPPHSRAIFEREDGADFAYEIENVSRFRVNAFRQINGLGAVFRAIPTRSSTLSELNLPPVLTSLCTHKQGMVLVTGKTGSGKSTTLAAMVNEINENRSGHIITIEDPIEFVHPRKRCLISQRQLGLHTKSFANALRSALREDPDVILVGEMRDLDTISLAVTAAETGILVMGTLHTNRAPTTVDRIINTFPANKQSQVRAMLSTSLRGIVSQQLVRKADGQGRAAAVEVLINTPAVANLIREGKSEQLESIMQSSALQGMVTMDSALRRLLDSSQISEEEAYLQAIDKSSFRKPAGYSTSGEPAPSFD
ncbi:MAG: type IV pilus twitching motility protein PilT [Gammaproteobacteria bacterium]|jgi:twitching motility protein PilT